MEQKVRQMEAEHSISQFAKKGIVLTAIMKLKQICNHPDQYLGQDVYTPSESGKFQLLKEICETIYEKRERVLVFTQFKEIADDLAAYLETVFHAKGYVLRGHGRPIGREQNFLPSRKPLADYSEVAGKRPQNKRNIYLEQTESSIEIRRNLKQGGKKKDVYKFALELCEHLLPHGMPIPGLPR